MGYSIFYKIHDAQKMQEKWDDVTGYIRESFKYISPYAKSQEADYPIADGNVIDIDDLFEIEQPLYFEKDNLVVGRDWIKTGLKPYTFAVETVLLIMAKVFGEDVFSLDGGDWEDIDIWYPAALVCKRIGLDIDLHEVKSHSCNGSVIHAYVLDIEIEEISDKDNTKTYAHCLFRPEQDYAYGYTMSSAHSFGVKIPAKSVVEYEENLKQYDFHILVKWNVKINGEQMVFYLLEKNIDRQGWMDWAWNFAMKEYSK